MRAMPTEMPLPVATIFSLCNGANGVVNSGVAGSSNALGITSVAEDVSERISESKSIDGADGDKIISETGRTPRRGVGRRVGAWTPDDRRRRNRFAFSRGPASFLKIESRRLSLGASSLLHTVGERVRRLYMESLNEGGPVKPVGDVGSLEADREVNCAGSGIVLAPIIVMVYFASCARWQWCFFPFLSSAARLGNRRLEWGKEISRISTYLGSRGTVFVFPFFCDPFVPEVK